MAATASTMTRRSEGLDQDQTNAHTTATITPAVRTLNRPCTSHGAESGTSQAIKPLTASSRIWIGDCSLEKRPPTGYPVITAFLTNQGSTTQAKEIPNTTTSLTFLRHGRLRPTSTTAATASREIPEYRVSVAAPARTPQTTMAVLPARAAPAIRTSTARYTSDTAM